MLIFEQVLARYFWSGSSVAAQELSWYLFSFAVMCSIAEIMKRDGHVRVDLLYARFSPKIRNWVNRCGIIVLVWPVCALGIYFGVLFTIDAFDFPGYRMSFPFSGEASPDPGGLPARWIPRSAIPLGFALIFLQSFNLIFQAPED